MKKNLVSKFLISFIFLIFTPSCLAETYASLCPVATEIIYALGAEKSLIGVSSTCNYPLTAKEKPVIGDTYFVNTEKLLKLNPGYIFALDSAKPKLSELSKTYTKPVYLKFETIEDIYIAIQDISKITNTEKNAEKLIKNLKKNIEISHCNNPKKILYLIQTNPIITIGNKSFITDIIKKSGHISVTEDLKFSYPSVTQEYILKTEPEIVILGFPCDTKRLKKLFPKSKFVELSPLQSDIINRPSIRVDEAVRLFSNLDFEIK